MSRRLTPGDRDASKAIWQLKRVPEGSQVSRFVLDSCGTMIDADGKHADEELRWGIEVSDALKAIAGRG